MQSRLFKTAYYTFVLLIIVVAVLMAISVLPITGVYKIKVVLSGSMEPEIHTGSVVVIKPSSKYVEGDIITFGKDTKKDVPTTHRITGVRIESGAMAYQTKGDANDSEDVKAVSQDEVIGKVLFSVPYIGYLIDMAKKPWGFVVLIAVPALLIIGDELANIFRESKKIINNKRKKKGEDTDMNT